MLHRSVSSRRHRASRSSVDAPQTRPCRSANTSPGRRASIAVSPVDTQHASHNFLVSDFNRSPRHSIIPRISLSTTQMNRHDEFQPRHSLTPMSLSPRGSLVPTSEASNRISARQGLVPGQSYRRSSRITMVPESLSPRNSLLPDGFNRSSRHSLADDLGRSLRRSITPNSSMYVSRATLPSGFNRSPRPSIVSESERNNLRSNITTLASSHSSAPDETGRSPQNSIASENSRSPRGSLGTERTSHRGNIASENFNHSPRGSLGKGILTLEDGRRSARGSLTLTFQEPLSRERRSSADNILGIRNDPKNMSPFKVNSRSTTNMQYVSVSTHSDTGSRRASSSVSGDEQRRLCADAKYPDNDEHFNISLSLTTYGSVAYQLKDANFESTGTCDFICKALHIVNRTVIVTVILVCLCALPLLMLIMGIQFLRDCPREPNIPIYMVVGGAVGCINMALILYNQFNTKRTIVASQNQTSSIIPSILSIILTLLLIGWFGLGNFWIFRIKWPDYSPTLFEPNFWCHRTLYVFALVHLCIVYTVFASVLILIAVLAGCQFFGCRWLGPVRYK